jgi:hypothetical protein
MTTNLISITFGERREPSFASACSETSVLPRVRPVFAMTGVVAGTLVADGQKHKSTGVSVPGCRGVT